MNAIARAPGSPFDCLPPSRSSDHDGFVMARASLVGAFRTWIATATPEQIQLELDGTNNLLRQLAKIELIDRQEMPK